MAHDLHLALVGASIALSLAIVVQALVDRDFDARLRVLLVGVAFAGACHALTLPPLGAQWPAGLQALWRASSCAGVPLLWLMIQCVFRDGFALRRWHAAAVGAAFVLGLAPSLGPPLGAMARGVLLAGALAIALDGVRLLVVGWAADLDERRRGLRVLLALVGPAVVAAVLVGHVMIGRASRPVQPATAVLGVMIAVKFFWLYLTLGNANRLRPLLRTQPLPPPIERPLRAAPGEPGTGRAPGALDADRIVAAMVDARLYRQPGLQVRELATHVHLPEYRVRQAIIEELGYRNFPAFVGRFRLREVAARLRRADDAHLPILTLALDAGFSSIGPFNRAFRDAYGVTPSAYRSGSDAAGTRAAGTSA